MRAALGTETPLEGRAGKGQDGRAGTREAKLPDTARPPPGPVSSARLRGAGRMARGRS